MIVIVPRRPGGVTIEYSSPEQLAARVADCPAPVHFPSEAHDIACAGLGTVEAARPGATGPRSSRVGSVGGGGDGRRRGGRRRMSSSLMLMLMLAHAITHAPMCQRARCSGGARGTRHPA